MPNDIGDDDGGLAIVRVKPICAGKAGVDKSGQGLKDGEAALCYNENGNGRPHIDIIAPDNSIRRSFHYMKHVIPPSTDNTTLYDEFMPRRIDAFLEGINVNVMAYGQTGTGKTHTMFGPPGIMERAGRGDYGISIIQDYGIYPRAVLDIFTLVKQLQKEGNGTTTYVLTASAVELSLSGNIDMLTKSSPKNSNPCWDEMGTQNGICLDKAAKPPRLYGMQYLVLDEPKDVLRIFSALSTRNVAGTGLNDTSSRSHCFAFLTLHKYNAETDLLTTSRFQFVDLAGNERMEYANGDKDYRTSQRGIEGMMTNYSLTMLSAAVRGLVESRKKKTQFSFRTYLFDLVLLLSESMTGHALTAVFVCVSQAPANSSITSNALDFGEVFSRLTVQKRKVKPVKLRNKKKELEALLKSSEEAMEKNISKKYKAIRNGQVRDCRQMLDIFNKLVP